MSRIVLLLTNPMANHSIEAMKEAVKKEVESDFELVPIEVSNWDEFLTPWEVSNLFTNRNFKGNALLLLEEIENKILPGITSANSSDSRIYIAGYSLAGLFSLWTLYNSTRFSGAVCCSSSLWYPGWEDYMSSKEPQKDAKVYLSLGKKKAKQRMRP